MELPNDTRTGLAAKSMPLVAPLSHPELTSLGTESIRNFINKRKAYERTLTERDQQEGTTSRPVSLCFSIEQDLLEDLVDLRQLGPEVEKVENISDSILQEWLEEQVTTFDYYAWIALGTRCYGRFSLYGGRDGSSTLVWVLTDI